MRLVSSGHLLEFRYRILDATKAGALNDKKNTPYLIHEKTGTRLTIPTMEKVGQLRQTAAPKQDHTYWMVFANEGKLVKIGDCIDLSIGKFTVRAIAVE